MVKKIVIEIPQNEYDKNSSEAREFKIAVNVNIATMESHILEIEDPGLKILLTECIRDLKTNITKLKNYVIFKN